MSGLRGGRVFGAWDLGFRVLGFGFRVWGLGFWLRFRLEG